MQTSLPLLKAEGLCIKALSPTTLQDCVITWCVIVDQEIFTLKIIWVKNFRGVKFSQFRYLVNHIKGNFHWVQIFTIFTDWSATVKCKPWKKKKLAGNFENCCDNLTITSARKKYSIIVVATWLFALSSQCRFWLWLTWEVPDLHMLKRRRGNHLVGVWLEWLVFCEIKTMKISPGESGGISVKFCTNENFI